MKVYCLKAFSDNINGGNPAGVVINETLEQNLMLSTAKKAGFSETAFVNKINEKEYKIRYFTPKDEVDLCGHATIAAFSLLKLLNLQKEKYTIHTKAGKINVFVDDIITMEQKLPNYNEIVSRKEILESQKYMEKSCMKMIQLRLFKLEERAFL